MSLFTVKLFADKSIRFLYKNLHPGQFSGLGAVEYAYCISADE